MIISSVALYQTIPDWFDYRRGDIGCDPFVSGHVVKTRRPGRYRNYYNLSPGASLALAEKPRTLAFAEARPQEEPDGKPHRGGAQFLLRVVEQPWCSRAGRVPYRGRRLPQH